MNIITPLMPADSTTQPCVLVSVRRNNAMTPVHSLRDLARAAAPFPFFFLPVELQAMIRRFLDTPSQLMLAETCTIERNIYTGEQKKWLLFKKNCLVQLNKAKDIFPSTNHKILEQYYRMVLSQLFKEEINDQQYHEAVSLAEKFFTHLPRKSLKIQFNQVLSTKPTACNWQFLFERLARANLHLCVTLITMAAAGFDPANENKIRIQRRPAQVICYPFTELYPFLSEQLQFNDTPAPRSSWDFLKDNIQCNNARAQKFFRQIREIGQPNTALHFAVIKGYMDSVPALVQNSPCIDLTSERGETVLVSLLARIQQHSMLAPIEDSINGEYKNAISILLNLKANPNLPDMWGNTALMYAAAGKYIDLDIIIALLEKGAKVDLQKIGGKTALIQAVENNRIDIVQTLLDWGANVNLQTDAGYTALTYAIKNAHRDIVYALLKKGADVNLQDQAGYTAFMHALVNQHLDIAELLRAQGANTRIKNNKGETALSLAYKQSYF